MKFKVILIAIVSVLMSLSLQGQVAEITNGLKVGNHEVLSKYFDNAIWMCIENTEDEYSSSVASGLLAEFFGKNKVIGFDRLHEDKNVRPGTEVIVGNMKTSAKNYRVYVYLNKSAEPFIDELRITSP